jgi:3-dehydroquinate synthase
VLGDIAGFAAAATLRGLPFVQVPTTLLSMVDSSVGGKTGVNTRHGKNLVGAFHSPRGVWIATDTLGTLPPEELRAGLGEVLKTAVVADPALFELAARVRPGDPAQGELLEEIIARCVSAKAAIVSRDERESGGRIVLNAGHTVAHALETAVGPTLRHGEAVAIGLVAEARWAVARGICADRDLPERIASAARAVGLPTEPPAADLAAVLAAARLDKKGAADKIRLPVPVRAGEVVVVDLDRASLPDLLHRFSERVAR